ncbi:IS481 family transposase (plasmid) [Arthrobacter sp. NicSoilB11]|nr:IS481 family transposase [Arthrobacter sp. NicSoilB11]GIU57960.1 IS481 family transposase [Arthrobacter sp. NicSoilC12]VXB95235.1 transposase [Arthrobacter sp. 8AJ]
MSHPNAFLASLGRLELAKCIVDDGWPLRRAAERLQVSVPTAARWAKRYLELGPQARELGAKGMDDRSSRPASSPQRTQQRVERRIIALRVNRPWGPARIACLLGLHPSTVHKVLSRYRLARLSCLDRATGRVIRRYEQTALELSFTSTSRSSAGSPTEEATGPWAGPRAGPTADTAKAALNPASHIHTAIDDYSRLAYSEILLDERQDNNAARFWQGGSAYFQGYGVSPRRVLTDNGSCYRSRVFNEALGPGIKHKYTRPVQLAEERSPLRRRCTCRTLSRSP